MPPLAQHLARRPARDPRARPEPRVHPQRAVHDAHRGRLVRRPGAPLRRATTATKVGVVEPAPAGARADHRATAATRFDQKVAITTYPDGRGGRGRARGRQGRVVIEVPADLSAPGEIRFKEEPDQAIAQIIVRGDRRAARRRPCSARATSTRRRSPPRSAAGGESRSSRRPSGPGAVPRRQHRRRADPRRHLQLRVHGPDRRRRGEAEPGRRGRPLDRPAARPADGQGPRHRRPRHRPARGLHRRRADRGARLTTGSSCPRRRPARSSCSPSGSSSATCCTRPRSGSSARSRRGMEEASNASTPVTMVAMISYFVAIFAVIDDPTGRSRRSRRSSRRRRRSSSRCGPRSMRSRRGRSALSVIVTIVGDLGPVLDRRAGLRRRRPPDGGRMKLRDAWRSAGE